MNTGSEQQQADNHVKQRCSEGEPEPRSFKHTEKPEREVVFSHGRSLNWSSRKMPPRSQSQDGDQQLQKSKVKKKEKQKSSLPGLL